MEDKKEQQARRFVTAILERCREELSRIQDADDTIQLLEAQLQKAKDSGLL